MLGLISSLMGGLVYNYVEVNWAVHLKLVCKLNNSIQEPVSYVTALLVQDLELVFYVRVQSHLTYTISIFIFPMSSLLVSREFLKLRHSSPSLWHHAKIYLFW